MKTGNLRNLLILFLLMVLSSALACSAGGRDVYQVSSLAVDSFTNLILPDDKPVLKKKILVAPVIDKAGLNESQSEEVRQDCISILSKDKYLLVTKLDKKDDNESESVLEKYGEVINPSYVKTAEEKGMDMVMTCVIHPLEITEKRTGIWPFRKDSYNVLITVSINALDTLNGTLIVYEDKTEDINFKKTTAESGEWTPDSNIIKDEILSMTKKLSYSVIDKLRKQPWQSKVIVDGTDLIINAGKAIGINENTVFEIFAKGELIDSFSNEQYYTFGGKIGETRVASISENRSVLASNIDLKDAAFVRVKRSDD